MMKLGRNEPCHCGSGKKYKHCHEPTKNTNNNQYAIIGIIAIVIFVIILIVLLCIVCHVRAATCPQGTYSADGTDVNAACTSCEAGYSTASNGTQGTGASA